MSMHTTQEWAQSAHHNMFQAQRSHRKAMSQQDQSSRAHEEAMSEHSLQHTRSTLMKLQEALAAKDPPLALVMWRMEQREKRPLREQVRDTVEVCLEVEKASLMDAQRRLKEFIKKTQATITCLENKLEELRHDIQQKTQALSVDELCLRTTSRSLETVADRSMYFRSLRPGSRNLPPSTAPARQRRFDKPSARHEVAAQESLRNEIQRQKEALRLNQSAIHREEAAKELRDEAQRVIQRMQRQTEDAQKKSDGSMKERVNENQQMRRRLESELRETCSQIRMTKNTLHDTKTHLRSLEEPMELTNTCASWRKQRASKEHTMDPVSTTLQEHQMTLLKCHEDLKHHHQNEKTVLQELEEKKEQLKEDLFDKTNALHIDLNCLTHESVSCLNGKVVGPPSISRQRLPKAMKVDPTFVPNPGGGVLMMPQMPLTSR